MCDTDARDRGLLSVEVGNIGIKDMRRSQKVPIAPYGQVSDYVPFYFAPRSPMMFSISKGNVPTYSGGTARLVYLVTSLERLTEQGHTPVLTDRNAALRYAAYRRFDAADEIDDGFIDWDVMKAKYWGDFDDGRERRMAEALVHENVEWACILSVTAQSEIVAEEARAMISAAKSTVRVKVVPQWYF